MMGLAAMFNMMAAPSVTPSGPAFVQGKVGVGTITLGTKATAGNLLVCGAGKNGSIATPSGWNLLGTQNNGSVSENIFWRGSDGTETGISLPTGVAGSITEWTGGNIGGWTGAVVTVSTATSATAGPSTAPVSPKAIPLMLSNFNYEHTSIAFGSGWSGESYYQNNYGAQYAYMATPPNAAVSNTLTINARSSVFLWTIVWIEPK